MWRLRNWLPALLLLLFSGWWGTFGGAAHGSQALAGHLVLLLVLAVAGESDPLRLEGRANLLLVLLAVALVLSLTQSPTPRAGIVGLLLMPAYIMIPPFVERCWADTERRRHGLVGVALVVAAVAGASLVGWWRFATPGASLPLGHHNFQAAWLVTLIPLALVPWREGGWQRVLALTVIVLAVTALLATRSLSGLVAMAFMTAWGLVCWFGSGRQPRRLTRVGLAALLVLVVLVVVLVAPARIADVASGIDVSTLARLGYLEGAWRGFLERPVLGWGPGAASWTLSLFLRPQPGIHPPSQVIADPHSLPARLLYENGLAVMVLGLALAAAVFRARLRSTYVDLPMARAAGLGILGFCVIALAGRTLSAPALPLAFMVTLGAFQASSRPRPSSPRRWIWPAAAVLIALLLARFDLAHVRYDRAFETVEAREQLALVRQAAKLDPAFPLYGARAALLERALGAERGVAEKALGAAEGAQGLAPLYLLAGVLGKAAGNTWAPDALLRACQLDPLGALAPFHLGLGTKDARAPIWTARSLLAEPYLIRSQALLERRSLAKAALAEIRALEAIDPSWTDRLASSYPGTADPAFERERRRLVFEMDTEPTTALSLHAFRRRPWPARIDEVTIVTDVLPDVEAVSRLRGFAPDLFLAAECGLPGSRVPLKP